MSEKKYVIDDKKLMSEWDWSKNESLEYTPSQITIGSSKKVWWKCSNGHKWQAPIKDRNNGHGCPYCSNRKVLQGYNDLKTVNPSLSKEWNYEKNNSLTAIDILPNSNKKVWWKCEHGHEWQATVYSRNIGLRCPYCSGKKVLKGYNDLQTINPSLAKEWNYEKNGKLKPEDFTSSCGNKVWWKCKHGHEWQAEISSRNQGRGCPYCANQKILPGFNDLQSKNIKLASEWHPTKNENLKPNMVSCGSGKIVWWKCRNGHEWQAMIKDRNNGKGCPICHRTSKKDT